MDGVRADVLVRPVSEELYRTQSARPAHSMGALFVAAMREWKSSRGNDARHRRVAMRNREGDGVTIAREIERLERGLLVLADGRLGGAVTSVFGTVWGS